MRKLIGLTAGLFLAFGVPLAAQDEVAASTEQAGNPDQTSADNSALEPRPPLIPTEQFAARSQISSVKLSPDGSRFAGRVKLDGKFYIILFDAETRQPQGRIPAGEDIGLNWFRWAGNNKILFSVSFSEKFFGDDAQYRRLFMVDLTSYQLSALGGKNASLLGDDVIHVADDGSYALVSVQRTPYEYPSVRRYALDASGEIETIQNPRDGIWNWVADDAGVVRLGTGWYRRRLRIYYRSDADDDLDLIARLSRKDLEDESRSRFWEVIKVVSGSEEGYVLDEDENGRVGVRKMNFASGEIVETFYQNDDWDVDRVLLDDDGEPLAAFYTDDRDRVVWFDEENERWYRMLGQATSEQEVWITSRARDGSRMLVWAGGESDPGALYVFTPEEMRLDLFASMRPAINFQQLVPPQPISYTARDGTEIRGYLTLPRGREAKNLPLIIMPHGGPYGIRDKLQYNDEVQLLANRGYAVLQPNYRGSGGYGDAFFELGTGQIGRAMQDDLDDAMDWAVAEGIADPQRVCLVGGSYGGYAAMWGVIRNPERYRCAASWAGVSDWDSMLKYDRKFTSRASNRRWRDRVEGEDFDLDDVSPLETVERLQRPLLVAHGTEDYNVPFKQHERFTRAARRADKSLTTLVIEDEGHSFSTPENEKKWYDALEAFLAEHNPAD